MSDEIRIRVSGNPTATQLEIISLAIQKLLDDEADKRKGKARLSDWQRAALTMQGSSVADGWSGDGSDGSRRQGKGEGASW